MKVLIGIGVLAVIALLVLLQTLYVVDETQVAVVTQLGRFVRSETKAGLKVKTPFIQSVQRFDKRLQRYDLPPAALITRDKKSLVIDAYARYRITDPLLFFQNLSDLISADAKVGDIVASELKKEVASHDQSDIIQLTREEVMQVVRDASAATARDAGLGIEILDVRIKRADFPTTIASSIYARMIAERTREANKFRAEGEQEKLTIESGANREVAEVLADANREALEIRGKAEAQAIEIFAGALEQGPEFYRFQRSLQAYRKFLKTNSTVVLSSDTDLFSFLGSPSGLEKASGSE